MISKAINAAIQNIVDTYGAYGIKMQSQYNSDLDMVSQYTKSLNIRSMLTETSLELLNKETLEALKKDSYVLLMYNYSPFKRSSTGRFNNINMEAVFDTNSPDSLDEFGKMKHLGSNEFSDFFRLLRDANSISDWEPTVDGNNNIESSSYPEDRENVVFKVTGLALEANSTIGAINNDDYVLFDANGKLFEVTDQEVPEERVGNQVRDLVMGEIEFTVKVLTTSTTIINDLQFITVQKLQRNTPFDITLDFGAPVNEHTFEFGTTFEEIDSVGHVDYQAYGNLQHLTFTFKIEGPFFSFYTGKPVFPIECIDVEFQITSGEFEPTPRDEWVTD